MKNHREFDIILWGATSFVGKLTAEYLLKRHGANAEVNWALGARNSTRLKAAKQSLGRQARDLPVLIGDAFDRGFLNDLASRTRVVLSTVGPYMQFGEPLVAACASQGTDYCDLTGEMPFVQAMMDKYGQQAEKSGARIVNCTGVDSVPSDMGVYYLNQFALDRFDAPLKSVAMHVHAFKGALSGGTVASLGELIAGGQKDPTIGKLLRNPYAICPSNRRSGVEQPSFYGVNRSGLTGEWLHHFLMAPVNTQVVHATNAHLNYPYGRDFLYSERQVASSRLRAYRNGMAIEGLLKGMSHAWSRSLLIRYVFPKPGEGPSRAIRDRGNFDFIFHGLTRNAQRVSCRVAGDADPGYGSTAKQVAEVALCLARSARQSKAGGGFWTPAAALGSRVIDPLIRHAGLTFENVDDSVL